MRRLVASLVLLSSIALADTPKAKMSMVDAARLDAALAHYAEAMRVASEHMQKIVDLCKPYGIDPTELGRTVGVNFDTGDIHRQGTPQKQPK